MSSKRERIEGLPQKKQGATDKVCGGIQFAQRTGWPLTLNKFSTDLQRLLREKTPILDLTESNPTHCGFSYSKEDIVSSLARESNLRYSPTPRGSIQARKAVCRYYKEKGYIISPEQIFLTASTSEAYSYLFRLLIDPGQQVLFPRPSYPLFSFLGDLNDVHTDTYMLCYDEKWEIDFKSMRRVFCDDTKVLVLVNPNNPTGSFIHRTELSKINILCREHNTSIICDEVFSDFVFDQNKDRVSLVNNDQVLTFALGGISKTLGLPQMKLSWIIMSGPPDLVQAAATRLEVITDTYLSVNTPVQNALPLWLQKRRVIQKEINTRIIQNFKLLCEHTKNMSACELLASEGGWYAVLKTPDTHSEEEWILAFLNKDHVSVHPGYFFDFDTEAFIVISLLPHVQIFQKGIKRIFKRIRNNEL